MPKVLVTLEEIFSFDDQAKGKGLNLAIGKDDHVPMIVENGETLNLEKVCSKTDQEVFIPLCQ